MSDRFHHLLAAYLDGELDDAGLHSLESLLVENPDLAREASRILAVSDLIEQHVNPQRQAASFLEALRTRIGAEGDATEFIAKTRSRATRPRAEPAQSPRIVRQRSSQPRRRSEVDGSRWLLLAAAVVVMLVGLLWSRSGPAASHGSSLPIVTIEALTGEAWRVDAGGRETLLGLGEELRQGELLRAVKGARLRLVHSDSQTVLTLRDAVTLRLHYDQTTRLVQVLSGSVEAEVAAQPAGRRFQFRGGHAVATVVGTRLRFSADAALTRLQVSEGRVRFARLDEPQQEVLVSAGQYAIAGDSGGIKLHDQPAGDASEGAWEFYRGINIGGESLVIDGQHWLSHGEAKANGMTDDIGELRKQVEHAIDPLPAVSGPLARMFQTTEFDNVSGAMGEPLSWHIPLPNGRYRLTWWLMENAADHHRSIRFVLEDAAVPGIWGELELGHWQRIGPHAVTVEDGVLDLVGWPRVEETGRRGHPHVMGIQIERQVAGSRDP